jgi:hypothetical protein
MTNVREYTKGETLAIQDAWYIVDSACDKVSGGLSAQHILQTSFRNAKKEFGRGGLTTTEARALILDWIRDGHKRNYAISDLFGTRTDAVMCFVLGQHLMARGSLSASDLRCIDNAIAANAAARARMQSRP